MERNLTRKSFLKMAGAGMGTALLGASMLGTGCRPVGGGSTNVVVVIIDSLRRDHVGAYGSHLARTPSLDAFAGESLRFTQPYSEAMPTIPARRAIHTGMRCFPYKDYSPARQKAAPIRGWLPVPDWEPTLAETLKDNGYATALITDTWHQFPRFLNFWRGFRVFHKIRGQEDDPYKDPSTVSEEEMKKYLPVQPKEIRQYLANTQGRKSEKDWFAPKVFTGAMDLLERARHREPFFLVADCYDPHEPWDPPEKYVSLYDPDGYEGREPFNPRYGEDDYLTDSQLLRMRSLYAGEVSMVDNWFGKFMQKADDLGLMDNTLFIVISDHGHLLGEHGYTGKLGYALYPELADTVFMIRHPDGRWAGQTSDFYASTHDVAPTVLGVLGLKPSKPMQGQDLSALLNGEDVEPRDHFTSGYGNYVRTCDSQYVMLVRDDKDNPELYDIRNDPLETRDIAADHPDIVNRMYKDYVLKDAGGSLPVYGVDN